MKILILSVHYLPNIGGAETHISDLIEALNERKNDVFLLTYQPLQTNASWKIYEKGHRYKIFRIPWVSGLFYKFQHKPVLEFLYVFPGIFIFLPFIIIFQRPDVIHAHGIISGFVAVFWAKIFRIRTVVSTHNTYNFSGGKSPNGLINWIFNNTDHVLCLSKQSAKEIGGLVEDKTKISIFTSWVDLNKFHPFNKILSKRKLAWKDKFVVLFVGRLVPEKGVPELLSAAKLFNKKIGLKIAGTGILEAKIGKYYIGKISQKDLPVYYSAADMVIVPSTHDEGFGRVIVEALACGTPVIGSNRGAIPQVMDESVGKLIDVTPKNIKETVEYFYNNPEKLRSLTKKARSFAERRYSNKNVESILSAYS